MLDDPHLELNIIIFAILSIGNLSTEMYAASRRSKGLKNSSQLFSLLFGIIGRMTPVFIVLELVFLSTGLPPIVVLPLAIGYLGTRLARILTIKNLGKFYSVHVCVFKEHKLIKTGIYKYFRHPIYLIGLISYPLFPLACGAYYTAIVMGIMGWIVIFIRRHEEEKILIGEFGEEYIEYRKKTFF